MKKIKTLQDLKFQEQIKLLLGYTSNRLNKYIYFNFKGLDNTIVLTNGNYELIASCSPVTLSIHILQFKDIDLFIKIKEFFKVPDNIPYVIRTELLLKALVQNAIETLSVKHDTNLTAKLCEKDNENVTFEIEENDSEEDNEESESTSTNNFYSTNDDEEINDDIESVEEELEEILLDSFPNKDIFGAVVNDVYSWTILEHEVLKVIHEYTDEYFSDTKSIIEEINLDTVTWYNGNHYRPVLITSEFFNEDIDDAYLICLDGQDTISVKGFLKKVDGICKLYTWVKNNRTVKCMAVYEDNSVIIKSTRPFYEIIPLKKK